MVSRRKVAGWVPGRRGGTSRRVWGGTQAVARKPESQGVSIATGTGEPHYERARRMEGDGVNLDNQALWRWRGALDGAQGEQVNQTDFTDGEDAGQVVR